MIRNFIPRAQPAAQGHDRRQPYAERFAFDPDLTTETTVMTIATILRRNGIHVMRYSILCGLAVCCTCITAADGRADEFPVTAPPAEMKLPAFYKKFVSAGGYPVVSSEKVSDYALKEAAYLVHLMLAERPDVRRAMVRSGSRMIVMAHNEFTTDIPEYAQMKPKDFWDARARGLGGSRTDPVCSCAEENVLCYAGDPYNTESIVIHEFAHNIHLRGLVNMDPTFDDRLKSAYTSAMAKGLWKTKYASVNHAEYWAEGVQSWFGNNRPPDHDHNHVDTRKELQDYDPGLAAMCEEVFGKTRLVYTKPATRLRGHLQGFNPAQAPRFRWPARLDAVRKDIRKKARNRGKQQQKPQSKTDNNSVKREQAATQRVAGWTQFRGPHGSGVAHADSRLPIDIATDQHVIWKRSIARGHSSPVIYGNRLYLTALHDRKLLTLALSTTTGETLWEHASEYDKLESVHRIGSPATSSVTTDGEVLVSFFGSCGMNAFDLDGKLMWQRPLGPFNNQFGATSSPILADDRIINIQDHDTGSYLLAIDQRNGKETWKTERPTFRSKYGS
ncbi:MAG: PQQ-binding-like beta-propeller repeat protein, partial [Planctomycetaceae bacterium]